jgi:hypothetical protein
VGSVVATWGGRCLDQTVQADLVGHLREIAAFTQACRDPALPIEFIDETIEGTIILDPRLLAEGDALIGEDGLGRLSRIRLYGVVFQPLLRFDFYRGDNTFQFVFVRAPELPALDGILVKVARGEALALYDSEVVQNATAYLRIPQIHLRYQFEAWADMLTNWVRRFFLKEFGYWRYEDNSGYDGIAFAPKDLKGRADLWRAVKLAYLDEATSYLEIEEAPRRAARRANDLPWAWLAARFMPDANMGFLSVAVRGMVPRERWGDLKLAAACAILKAGCGANLDYLAFSFGDSVFALSSRLRPAGLSIDIDVVPSIPPRHIIRARNV